MHDHVVEHPHRPRREPVGDADLAVRRRARPPAVALVVDPADRARRRQVVAARRARPPAGRGRCARPSRLALEAPLHLLDPVGLLPRGHAGRDADLQAAVDQPGLDGLAPLGAADDLDVHRLVSVRCRSASMAVGRRRVMQEVDPLAEADLVAVHRHPPSVEVGEPARAGLHREPARRRRSRRRG